MHGEGQQASEKENKNICNKDTGKFHSQSHFINLLAGGFAHLSQGAVARAFVHNLGGLWLFLLCSSKGTLFSLFAK